MATLAYRKMTREEKYRNIKIDDMLSGQAQGKNYGITAIDQFKKNRKEQKWNRELRSEESYARSASARRRGRRSDRYQKRFLKRISASRETHMPGNGTVR